MNETPHPNTLLKMTYAQPAANDTEAMLLGNGRLGASVYGGTATERIALNDDTFWTGSPHDNDNPRAGAAVPRVQQLIFEGKWDEAQHLMAEDVMGRPGMMQCYQPLAALELTHPGHEQVQDYHRELDLGCAVARVRYRVGDTEFQREIFVSHPADLVVVRLTAARPGALNFDAALTSKQPEGGVEAFGTSGLRLAGVMGPRPCPESQSWSAPSLGTGLGFEALLEARCEGGQVTTDGEAVRIRNADAVTLLVAAGTSFVNFRDISADPHARALAAIQAAPKEHSTLLTEHISDYCQLFDRVSVHLQDADGRDLTAPDKWHADPIVHYQYGRYLLIASSRAGTQAANLQGIWNDRLWPHWGGKYTLNINIQMNYWPAEVGNLPECHLPLVDLVADLSIAGAKTAREMYGCGGFIVHHNTDLWRLCAPVDGVGTFWPMGGAWLATHLWEHYLFTGDREFLRNRGYPLMRAAAEFYVESMVQIPPGLPQAGKRVTCPSSSPEQGPPGQPENGSRLAYGPTIDVQIIHHLLTGCIEAAELLDIDAEFQATVRRTLEEIPPMQVGQHGQLQEWIGDWDDPARNHHHVSHLYGLYPGQQLAPEHTPELTDAVRTALVNRKLLCGGFPGAWRGALWARLKDGGEAYDYLEHAMAKSHANLLAGEVQMDGPPGVSACFAEMLLQSHARSADDPRVRVIELLPALPGAWPGGRACGLRARGGFEVDMQWATGELSLATIRSDLGGRCCVRYRSKTVSLQTEPGESLVLDGSLAVIGSASS